MELLRFYANFQCVAGGQLWPLATLVALVCDAGDVACFGALARCVASCRPAVPEIVRSVQAKYNEELARMRKHNSRHSDRARSDSSSRCFPLSTPQPHAAEPLLP